MLKKFLCTNLLAHIALHVVVVCGGAIGIVNNVFKLILLVTKFTLLSCCVLRL